MGVWPFAKRILFSLAASFRKNHEQAMVTSLRGRCDAVAAGCGRVLSECRKKEAKVGL